MDDLSRNIEIMMEMLLANGNGILDSAPAENSYDKGSNIRPRSVEPDEVHANRPQVSNFASKVEFPYFEERDLDLFWKNISGTSITIIFTTHNINWKWMSFI